METFLQMIVKISGMDDFWKMHNRRLSTHHSQSIRGIHFKRINKNINGIRLKCINRVKYAQKSQRIIIQDNFQRSIFQFNLVQLFYLIYKQSQIISIMKTGNSGNGKQQAMNKVKQICGQTEKFDKKIVGKDFLMGKYFDAQKVKHISKKQKKYTRSKIQKLLSIQQKLADKQKTYAFYLPLHNLWKAYTTDLLKNDKNDDSIYLKLLRADYHGALVTVIKSSIDSYIGLTGIIINESLKTFKIIGSDHRIRTLLKNQIIFQVQIMEKYYSVNGNCLIFRSTDRSKHKFKSKSAQKLNIKFMNTFLNDSD